MSDISVVTDSQVAKVVVGDIPDLPGTVAEVFSSLGDKGISPLLITAIPHGMGRMNIVLVLPKDIALAAKDHLVACHDRIAGSVALSDDVATISISGQLDGWPRKAARMFRAIASTGVSIQIISWHKTCITCAIDARYLGVAEAALKKEFNIS